MIWFKNMLIYRIARPISFEVDDLEKKLDPYRFHPCGQYDMAKHGWVPPLGEQATLLAHHASGHILLCAQQEEKILPANVIRQTLQQQIKQLEEKQARKLHKNEKQTLKENVIQQLLPRAFSRFIHTYLWIDIQQQLIIIDTTSSKRAETQLALLRKCLGSLPVTPLTLTIPIESSLTQWVRNGTPPSGLQLLDEAELKTSHKNEGSVIHCKQQDLQSNEILNHLDAGKQITKLLLLWRDKIQFMLTETAGVKRLKFCDLLLEKHTDIPKEDIVQRRDADFILMSGELSLLLQQMITALGGEVPTANLNLATEELEPA